MTSTWKDMLQTSPLEAVLREVGFIDVKIDWREKLPLIYEKLNETEQMFEALLENPEVPPEARKEIKKFRNVLLKVFGKVDQLTELSGKKLRSVVLVIAVDCVNLVKGINYLK